MPPQKRAAARGRRDPNLLEAEQNAQHVNLDTGEPEDYDSPDFDSEDVQILFEGDSVRVSVSIPVNLTDMDRYSIVQAEAHAHVRDSEGGIDTVERALTAVRYSFFTTIEKMEDDLRAYAEQQAADAAAVDRQVRTGR